MVSDVINAITEAMAAEFLPKDGYEIYVGDVPQDFEPKNFIVNLTAPSRDKKTYVTYEYVELIAIQYFPESHTEINDIVTRLQDCLEVISVTHGTYTKKTRTTMSDFAVVDGIMTAMFRVSDVYFKLPNGDPMTNIEIGVSDES